MRVVATSGHVDHGKSTLVRALTGTDPDRWEEEKARGLTIDLGFAHLEVADGVEVSFIDVPGHSRFLSNMLSGVGAVDATMFVVAADDGWMPQSEEHLRILELFGVNHGFVALTKRDQVDDDLAELALMDIESRVEGTFLEGQPIIAVSAHTGEGMDALRAELAALVERTPKAADRGRPRLWIDRVFAPKGAGTVVTGTLTGGAIAVDQQMVVEPGTREVRVRGIQSHGTTAQSIDPGNRVALNLTGVGHADLVRGDVVVEPDRWHLTDRVDADLVVLDAVEHEVSRRGAYVGYFGSRAVPLQLRVLGDTALQPGARGAVRLYLPNVLPLLPGDRFVLRESGRDETVGGGEILDIDPLVRAADARPDRSIERVVSERGWVSTEQLERLIGEPVDAGDGIVRLGTWVATQREFDDTERRLRDTLEATLEGVDMAALADHERALIEAADWADVNAGRALLVGATDPFEDHPLIEVIRAGGFSPEPPADMDRHAKRELVRRGVLVERESIVFHREVIEQAALVAALLLRDLPDGFRVSDFRDRTDTSRKFSLALLAELDGSGVTRRRDDVRVAGPRLPTID